MKKSFLLIAAAMLSGIVSGVEIQLKNNSPVEIVGICYAVYSNDDGDDNSDSLSSANDFEEKKELSIAPGAELTVRLNDKFKESLIFYIIMADGEEILTGSKSTAKGYTVSMNDSKCELGKARRGRRDVPGQAVIKNRTKWKISSISVRPSGTEEWQECKVLNARKHLYEIPKSGRCDFRFTTNFSRNPQVVFENIEVAKYKRFSLRFKKYLVEPF